jgi:hypothetical protein
LKVLRHHIGLNHDRQENQLWPENDKSYKEDHTMRLYEFADPTKYFSPDIDTANLVKHSKNIRTADAADDALRCLRKRPETNKPKNTL